MLRLKKIGKQTKPTPAEALKSGFRDTFDVAQKIAKPVIGAGRAYAKATVSAIGSTAKKAVELRNKSIKTQKTILSNLLEEKEEPKKPKVVVKPGPNNRIFKPGPNNKKFR